MFPSISPKQSFPALESEVLAYWKANNTFKKSIETRSEDNPYRFYDGPPFITGTPHYGSLLSSIVKDVVWRYWTMRGKRVDRVWWWDCHGLPIEEKVQKKLGLASNREIEERGVKEFIDGCYEYTAATSAEWDWYIDKIGRWVDMDRAYRTMDQDYMESVMWVFKRLWDQELIYEGKRVSLYSWKLGTPISNFEVAMDDTYQEVNDPAITVKFKLEANKRFPEGTQVLAWTTTPWTIPANMALAVRNDIDYVLVTYNGEYMVVAKNRAESVFKWKGEYVVEREFNGTELVGLGYTPPFPEYYYEKNGEKNHKIYHADFITDTDGTGIGHEAPEFGDVDFQLAKKEGIFISEAMDEAGKYTAQIHDFEWLHYQEANKVNIERMKENGTLFKNEGITHRVPFCPRSNTPLVQKAQKSWFIDIQGQKERLLQANEQINWFPEHLKFGRFAKGIESAPDWCISRTRYWGAPMPVWQTKDASERVVVSSREEIFEMNKPYGQLEKQAVDGKTKYFFQWGEFDGVEFNLHKPYIDSVFLAPKNARKAGKVLGVHGFCRTDDVVDFLKWTRKNLETQGVHMDEPVFEKGNDVNYMNWAKKFEELNLSNYDTVLTHSLGSRAAMNYIIENKIIIDRLVMVAPGMESTSKEVQGFYDSLDADVSSLKNYVNEVIVLASKDDLGREGKAKTLAELVGARYVEVNGFGHFNLKESKLIEWLVLHGEPLVRISEVLDVWMDSGSMPYAQMHYPFENQGEMQASFPADFIAEYVGQVRAWFYVMHVLGVLVNPNNEKNPTPSFTNVITTGVINGNDGRKMSKSYGNYPDPRATIEKYGADPIRFYMLNSPLLSWGDMDFKEEQIIDTVKGVMLPLWNTYSFFTTYANIDNWVPDETEVWFSRHGESTSNVANRMSDNSDNPELTEKWILQAHEAGKTLKSQWVHFDIIIHTSKIRAKHTAESIAEELGYTWEFIVDDRFAEQDAWEFAGKTHEEMLEQYNAKTGKNIEFSHEAIRRIYKEEGWKENIEAFTNRIIPAYREVLEKYRWKKILIVAHAGTSRPILDTYFGKWKDEAHFHSKIANAEPFRLVTIPLVNDLDRWILSKLQVLLGQVHDAMDGYDVSRACRAIVDYMDHLTNWYVRLSRRRFWESGMTDDKKSAYSTLHTVLVELSKLMAPFMPFIAESVFQGLTRKESVHLEYVTFPNRHLVASDLNRDMEKCEHIVSLGLALRSSKNIRVRQPLSTVTITAELSEYYQAIIRDELNVKSIKLENPERLAKKIAKPDAKKIGPKYGKDVQSIIVAAKNGEFTELDDGKLQVGNFVLESWEYTLEYLPLEWVGDVIGWYGMVVAMDTTITEELKIEGYARDIIRLIQDMRKEADYNVTDRIKLSIIGEESDTITSRFGSLIESETLSTLVSQIDNPDTMREESIDEDNVVQIAIKR